MTAEAKNITIATFYRFFKNKDYIDIKEPLKQYCTENGIKGIIIMATEGVNATLSGDKADIDKFFLHVKQAYGFEFFNVKESTLNYHPFRKIKVKAKKEIVTLGMPEISGLNAGEYVAPEQWDEFISKDDVVLVDTRNAHEIVLGSFEGAINPETENFGDFPEWFENNKDKFVGKKIAMCCTGGVRCEKSTAYLKSKGYNDVYHLEGGILNYLQKLGSRAKKWYGDCFVFDQRLAVDKDIKQVFTTKCQG